MTTTQPHDSLACNLGPDSQPCTMCWWANGGGVIGKDEHHVHDYQTIAGQSTPQCACGALYDYEGDSLIPPPNFESAWATAPREYSRYTEESHALYWYLRGMQDEQRITQLARQSLAREDMAEMGRLAQVRREG